MLEKTIRLRQKLVTSLHTHKLLIENFSYLVFLQVFLLVYPLITYPYLVKTLGKELYGIILTAQMLASYASLFIDFGSNFVCAKHISINRNDKKKLGEILSNVLFVRLVIFVLLFLVYALVAYLIPIYRQNYLIFILTYGFCTNELLFPQFFFQGIERMKMISIVNVFTKLVMVLLIFLIIKSKQDAYLVPIVYSIGFLIGGIVSLYDIIIHMKIKLIKPTFEKSWFYVKDSLSIFSTDLVCTIKDKLSYLLIGTYVGMSDVVIYDLGLKLHGIAAKPYMMICTVMFPRLAKTRDVNQLKRVAIISLSFTIILVVIANIFLSDIVLFFLHEHCDLIPLRLFLIGPIILSVSYVISNNMFVAFGYNKYMFKSILVTTIVYIFCLVLLFLTHHMNTIMAFICIALISYAAELIYRLIKAQQIIKIEKKDN